MARGKNKAASAARRGHQQQEQLDRLAAELLAEQTQLAAAQQVCSAVDEAEARIGQSRDRVARATAAEREDLRAQAELWSRYVDDELVGQAAGRLDRAMALAGVGPGAGTAAVERVMRHFGLNAHLVDNRPNAALDSAAIGRIERARGAQHYQAEPEDLPVDLGAGQLAHSSLFDDLPPGVTRETLASQTTGNDLTLHNQATQAVRAALGSRPGQDLSMPAIHRWQPSPLPQTTIPGPLQQQLGAPANDTPVHDLHTTALPVPTADLSADHRSRMAATVTPSDLHQAWLPSYRLWRDLANSTSRYTSPMAPRPRAARPVDAALLRHQYHLAGLAQWSRDLDAGSHTPGLAEMTIAAGCAAPFWMPPGQTGMFIDLDPLEDDLASELRLPFPNVFCAFADPLRIPPRPSAPKPIPARVLGRCASQVSSNPDMIHEALKPYADQLSAAIDYWGAWVEGLVLTSDMMGRPTGTIGWCIAVCPDPSFTLARLLIPATIDHSALAPIAQSAMAVIGWAGWDHPNTDLAAPASPPRDWLDLPDGPHSPDTQLTDIAAVHVLNVRHTTSSSSPAGDTPTRSVRPHLRRGHWRRSRVGTGRAETRWVRIAPTVVNAGMGQPGQAVYRLPAPGTGG